MHRSPQLMVGHWGSPELTTKAFEGAWFHSGDLGRLDEDGFLWVIDRKKNMIRSGGENVASREVEECIEELDGVAEVAVFGLPDPRWIEAVTAAVVPRDGVQLSPDDVIAHCRSHLTSYKTPKRVVVVDALPKNASGKVLQRDLRVEYGG